MRNLSQLALATLSLGLALGMSAPAAAETGHYVTSNAIDKCQAFTPGVSNTIRNRVTGAQNVGTATISVACAFELDEVYGMAAATVDDAHVYLYNPTGSAVTVNCTLLPGNYYEGIGTAQNGSVALDPGETDSVDFSVGADEFALGVNCNLPPNIVITETLIRYRNG